MLVLSRKPGERLIIGDDIVLVINKIAGNRVTIAIEAPREVRVVRGELAPHPQGTSNGGEPSASTSRIAAAALTSPLGGARVSLAGRHVS
jgi:carbon storage regulator